MSAIDTAFAPGGQPIPIVDANDTGFNALDAEAFLKLMIVQLQNQDPTEPTSNEELLGQISQMRSLEASIELEDTIKLLAESQTSAATTTFASSAASLIGRQATGTTAEGTDEEGAPIPGESIEGEVNRAVLRDGKVFVGIGDQEIPIENLTKVE